MMEQTIIKGGVQDKMSLKRSEIIIDDDHEIWADDKYNNGYPWKGALIASGAVVFIIVVFFIPWIVGVITLLS